MRTIVAISGTSRPDNYTSRALAVVTDELARLEVDVRVFDARELTLAFPGLPATDDAVALTEAVESAAGVVLATPEYHGTFAAMAKLVIENLGFPSALSGKAMGLVGVAAGRIGAIKSLEHLRAVCAHVGAVVMPFSVSIAGVRGAFDADGKATDPGSEQALRNFARSFDQFIADYVCPKQILENMVREGDSAPLATVTG